jgi:hypothetical protein
MQQRRLRLGDILDDYCPRERRITNHAVVAMIDDQVKQTRCTTCDADHEYREARTPTSRRRKEAGALADANAEGSPAIRHPEAALDTELSDDAFDTPLPDIADNEPLEDAIAVADAAADDEEAPPVSDDEGPVHRRLIRATLPRPEGQAPEWKEPEFTIRQPGRGARETDGNRNGHGGGQGRPGGGRNRRHSRGGGGGQGNAGGPARFGGPRNSNPRHGGGPGGGQRPGGNRPGGPGQRGPGRKRGR